MNKVARFVRPIHSIRRRILVGSAAVLLGALAAESQAESPNLLENGGFESGNFRDWRTSSAAVGGYYGVTNRDASSFFEAPPSTFGAPLPGPHPISEGRYAAFFGGIGPGLDSISQTVNGLIHRPLLKGKYKLSFQLALNGNTLTNPGPSEFRAQWDGKTVYSSVNPPLGDRSYQKLEFTKTAESDSATVLFASYNLQNFHYLDDVSLTLVGYEQSSFVPYARTPNQRAVARAVDSTVPRDEKPSPLVWYLDYRDLGALPGDFDRIAPEELSSIFTISTALAQVQNTNLQRRTDDIRSGSTGFSAAGLAMQGSGPAYSGTLSQQNPQFRTGAAGPSGKESKEVKQEVPEEKKWGVFLTGVGEWVDVDGNGNARGYDITTGGFTLGIDYKVCANFAIGIAAGYAGTSADLTDNGRVWVNGGKLGVYATAFTGGWYGDVAVTGGLNSYDTKRSAIEGAARGDTDGQELNVLVGTGYDWKIGALQIGPTATFQYTVVDMDGFTEHGSLAPLAIDGRSQESLRSTVGFKMSADLHAGGVVVRPELRAAWQHEYGDQTYDISASFANGAGNGFLVNGPEIGRDSLVVGAGVAVLFNETFSTYVYYDGDLFRENYDSHSVSGGVRISF